MLEIERKGGDRQISALARIKMERDEATQTDEGEGRAIPSNQRWYRYVFVRDNYPTWVQTSNWGRLLLLRSSAFSLLVVLVVAGMVVLGMGQRLDDKIVRYRWQTLDTFRSA